MLFFDFFRRVLTFNIYNKKTLLLKRFFIELIQITNPSLLLNSLRLIGSSWSSK
ncbi:hypothetical protein AWRIB129_1470 [Oenococcus oeni DSM 20252 = AWRIB129]|nr:hypothetical protein AWRIB129_1470 [Oenococcus oeni DSM 20252 = AWRIB129]SYW13324.1 hypothetical protein OENI_80086 [Oenococcus oeni]SYW16958.1 hypothetical protein OENI_70039 [Oenococcus oeni]